MYILTTSMKKWILAGALAVSGCVQPHTIPAPASLEERLLPSESERQDMLHSVQLIRVKKTYIVTDELFDPIDKVWRKFGSEKKEFDEHFGSGVVVAEREGHSYILTAAHVVDTETRKPHMPVMEAFRKQEKNVKTEISLVTNHTNNNGIFSEEQLPVEVLAISPLDIALVRVKKKLDKYITGFEDVMIGDQVFGTGYAYIPTIDIKYLSSNQRMIKMFNVGFVKSLGDPSDKSDDHVLYVNMNTQPGNSGGPVFTRNLALAGMHAHTLAGGGATYQGIVSAKAIKQFLKEQGL